MLYSSCTCISTSANWPPNLLNGLLLFLCLVLGVVSIEAMGGPSIPFRAGRVDAMDPSVVTPDGRLPEVRVADAVIDPRRRSARGEGGRVLSAEGCQR